jgi:hypothetical protein
MGFKEVGKVWTPETLKTYLQTQPKPGWVKSITFHHTWFPALKDRPKGFTIQHIANIKSFYENEKRWDRGPHFFVDEDQIFGMTSVTEKGIHAASFNSSSIGIEVLGDYDTENPSSGRGLACWKTATELGVILAEWLGLPVTTKTILFHRDDPKTTKSCPGNRVTKTFVLNLMKEASKPKAQPEKYENWNVVKSSFLKKTKISSARMYGDKIYVPFREFINNLTKEKFDSKFHFVSSEEHYYGGTAIEDSFMDGNILYVWIREALSFTDSNLKGKSFLDRATNSVIVT